MPCGADASGAGFQAVRQVHRLPYQVATLVAVGTHEHRRVAGIVLGSGASRMLDDAACSVLLARPLAEEDAFRALLAP